jgi:D-alanine-D-alanine ligase
MRKHINKKMAIAVLCGGFEPERESSFMTGKNVLKAVHEAGFLNSYILEVNTDVIHQLIQKKPDFAFISLFCKWGEDGVIQGALETLGIPYSGSGVEASVLCKNKYIFSNFVRSVDLNSPKSFFFDSSKELLEQYKSLISFPFIIKPARQGYSLGVCLIKNEKGLKSAAQAGFMYGSGIVIQEYIQGDEYSVGVVKTDKPELEVLPIIEIDLKGREIQDFDTKDDPTLIEEIIPARLEPSRYKAIQEQCISLFKKLGCLGVSRFDIKVTADERIYFLENNTCPGIVSYENSYLPRQLDYAGYTLKDYVTFMIKSGYKRFSVEYS